MRREFTWDDLVELADFYGLKMEDLLQVLLYGSALVTSEYLTGDKWPPEALYSRVSWITKTNGGA